MIAAIRRAVTFTGRVAIVALNLLFTACPLLDTPVEATGRSGDPGAEVLVVHSLAETVTSVAIDADGSPTTVVNDVTLLGSVPNDIVETDGRYAVTLSGENALLLIDTTTLAARERYDFGPGSNPMNSAALEATAQTPAVVATSELLTDTVTLLVVGESSLYQVASLATGDAPQAVAVLAGTAADTVRVMAANTAFSVARPAERPFGAATLSTWDVRFTSDPAEASGWSAEIVAEDEIALEADGFDGGADSGLNPVALIDVPIRDEIIIVGSGINYGNDGLGAEDGTVVVLNRTTLAVEARIAVGGSPGAATIDHAGDTSTLFLAGPGGIRTVRRNGAWDVSATLRYEATGGSGTLSFVADVAVVRDRLWAADFGRSRLIVFSFAADGTLTEETTVAVSQGPIALWVDDE